MKSDWPIHKLSDFINVKHGYAFKGEFFQSKETVDLLVTPGNFSIGGGFKSDKFKYYDGPVPDDYVLGSGDLVVTMTDLSKEADTLGYSALIPKIDGHRLLHNQRVGLIEFKNQELDKTYLYFLLRSREYRNHIIGGATGSTVKHTSPTKIMSFEFNKPPKDIQVEIGKKLISLEHKIELNRQTNQTLENIAQAIFKSWFVDFEPTRAKIEARENGQDPERAAMAAIAGKEVDELNSLSGEQLENLKSIAALFPDTLVDSALGEIPSGWEAKPLSEMVELIGGGTPKKSEDAYWNGDIPWFSVKDAPADGDVFVIDTEAKITELGLNKSSTKLLPVGVTIISARGTVGRLALVGTPTAMNQSCYGVKGANNVASYLNYFNLKKAVSTLQQNTHGAVFDTITRDTFDTVFIVDFSDELKNAFEELVMPNFEKIKNNLFETRTLELLRDALLPKLLSGELATHANTTELEASA